MITKTRGIVLNYIKYGDTSIICKIYTEQFGLQSYIINGIRKSKSKNIGLFQPLNILDLVVYHKKTSGLQRIKESKLDYAYKTLHLDMKKISVCFFLSEFLTRISQNDDDQKDNFDFIKDSLIVFDRLEVNYSNFHIQFLIHFPLFHCSLDLQPHHQKNIYYSLYQLLLIYLKLESH